MGNATGSTPPEKRVLCHIPFDHRSFELVGGEDDMGVVGIVERLGHYEPNVMLMLRRVLADDAVCVDGGANIGAISLAMALLAPRGTVHAFEPGHRSYDYLCENLRINDIHNVVPHRVGLWSDAESRVLYVDEHHPGGAHVTASDAAGSSDTDSAERIDLVRLDDWAASEGLERLDLIKLDIEGGEPWALQGTIATIKRLRPALLIEFNPATLTAFHDYSHWELLHSIRELYPVVGYVREDGTTVRVRTRQHISRLLQRKGFVDLLCLPMSAERIYQTPYEMLRSAKELLALLRTYNRRQPASPAFMYAPAYEAAFTLTSLRLEPAETTTVGVTLTNRGDTWLNSDWDDRPVLASYHWCDPAGNVLLRDGERTRLPQPVAPGSSCTIDLAITAPSAAAEYRLRFSLVQEHFAWADSLRPDLAIDLDVSVR